MQAKNLNMEPCGHIYYDEEIYWKSCLFAYCTYACSKVQICYLFFKKCVATQVK